MGLEDDDVGYVGYVPNTVDLGSSLFVGAFFALLTSYGVILPVLVSLNRRRHRRRKAIQDANDVAHPQNGSTQGVLETRKDDGNISLPKIDEEVVECGDSTSAKSTGDGPKKHASSDAVAGILDHPHLPKSKGGRRRRAVKEAHIQQNRGGSDEASATFTLMQGIHPGAIRQNDFGGNSTLDEVEPLRPLPFAPKYASEFNSLGALDKLAMIGAWDIETKRIARLSAPYCIQAFITGLTDTLNVAVIGNLIGTKEVSAFVIVNLLLRLTSEIVGGFHEAEASLCSQAIGARNKKLAGEYCQIVFILYTLLFIPCMFFWVAFIDDALRWFGFDEETVAIGKQYNYILVFDLLFDGLGEAVHGLLDVCGLEKYSTWIGATEEILAFVGLLLAGLYYEGADLITVGLIQFGLGIIFLVLNLMIIYWFGWFKPYREGMIGTFALSNGKSVWLVCKTALSLAFGRLLTDGEWEILTIFASFMGPAEVAAWGILDTIFKAAHELVDAMADASEVRCAFLLGSGDPVRAKVSAYKSMYAGTFTALFITSFTYTCGNDLPTWLTSDPTLQQLLSDLLPLFGMATLVMALSTMNWTLLGSQGRYRLATAIVCVASWGVTIPLATIFSVVLHVNLQGQMFAFIVGYLVMGILHSYFLLTSNWEKLSIKVMADHEAELLLSQGEPSNVLTSGANPSLTTPAKLPMEIASGGAAA